MTEMIDIFSDECSLGLRCPTQHCGLFHPTGWNWRRNVPCPSKAGCRTWACQYWHHRGHAPINREKCPRGLLCPHTLCGLDHGIGWDWRKNTECSTEICYNKFCVFKHTNGQKLCRCQGCFKVKEPFSFVVPVVREEEKCRVGFVMPKSRNYCSQKCQDKDTARFMRAEERRRVEAERQCALAGQRMGFHFGHDDTDDDYDERERRYYREPHRRRVFRRGAQVDW